MKRFFASVLVLLLTLSLFSGLAAVAGAEMIEQDGFTCERLRNGSLKLTGYQKKDAGITVNIPASIDGSHVESIGAYAFDGCKMAAVTIPDTVKMIEAFAFNDCTEIQKISIPNTVTFIDGNPFTGCSNLVNISLEPKHPTLQVTSDGVLYSKQNRMLLCYPCSKPDRTFSVMSGTVTIGKNAFYGCALLESITLPSTIKAVGDSAFLGCTSLKNIALPESLLSIGELAFAGCKELSGAVIPRQVLRIEPGTFYNCEALTSVALPENLTTICDRAFFGCKALHEIYIPANVNTIGDAAFFGCSSLTDAHIPVSVTEIGDAAFDDCSVRLYMHLDEYAYAEIYAKRYDISFTYGNEDSFLVDPPADKSGEKTITMQARGLTGCFPVNVVLSWDGTIKSVTVGESDSDADKGFLALAATGEFLNQFAGRTAPVEGLDVSCGATVSRNGIIDAVNGAASNQ